MDLVLVMAVPYVENEIDLIKLVFLNRHINENIKYEVYKECLIRENEVKYVKRMSIWNVLLPHSPSLHEHYYEELKR